MGLKISARGDKQTGKLWLDRLLIESSWDWMNGGEGPYSKIILTVESKCQEARELFAMTTAQFYKPGLEIASDICRRSWPWRTWIKLAQYRALSKQRKARLALGRTQEDYTYSFKDHTLALYPCGRENGAERRNTVYGKLLSDFIVQS